MANLRGRTETDTICCLTTVLSVVGYARCSSQEQAIEGVSLEAQRRRIEQRAELSGAALTEVIEDAGVSGTRPLAQRAGGAKIVDLLDSRRPPVQAVVVARLDRLGRTAAETLAYLRRFSNGPVKLVSIAERLDLTTPQGMAMAQVGAVFAELERALIAERTADALSALRNAGRVYSPTPFGYQAEGGHLHPLPEEQRVLAKICRYRNRGLSYGAIASRLNARGDPAKRGGLWYGMSVRSVLRTSQQLQEVDR